MNTTQANVTASHSVTVDTPETTITGNVQIDGDLNVDGATSLGATVTSNGKDISDTHAHPQGNDSDGDTQVDTGGVV